MRAKIIAVFAVIVLVVGGLSYALTKASLGELAKPGESRRALGAASAQLQLDALLMERWLSTQAADPKNREPFDAGVPSARGEAATSLANRLRDAAAAAPELAGITPALVVLIDAQGKVVGRNGSQLMRGDDLGAAYPQLKRALTAGATGSEVWYDRKRNEQLLASFAPMRGASGEIVGVVAVGTSLNDERLNATSERTSGGALAVILKDGEELVVVAKSSGVSADVAQAFLKSPAKEGISSVLTAGQRTDVAGLPDGIDGSATALEGYGDKRRAVIVSVAKLGAPEVLSSLGWSTFFIVLLGLVLTAIGGHLLDAYISRPISEIEDGLLAVINGRTDRRFEIEHAELGGLVFRLNSLLNQLLGVQEDDTDEQGRPSHAPTSADFRDALEVDEQMIAAGPEDLANAKALREEPDTAYYERIHGEFVRAKRSLGDPTEHITREAFIARIMASERELAQKHGKPVRYKVDVRGKEVALVAVPLA